MAVTTTCEFCGGTVRETHGQLDRDRYIVLACSRCSFWASNIMPAKREPYPSRIKFTNALPKSEWR